MNRFNPLALTIEQRRTARQEVQRTWRKEYSRPTRGEIAFAIFICFAIVVIACAIAYVWNHSL